MLTAIVLIVASQVALATLLFGSAAIDRPDLTPLVRAWARRRHGELASLRAHQRLLSGLRRATERSMEGTSPLEAAPR